MNAVKSAMIGFVLLVSIPAIFFTSEAWAEFPERNVTFIVGFDPGGAIDVLARAVAVGAQKHLGKSLIIENKGGAVGTVALAVAATAKPDGYTVCTGANVSIVDTPLMHKVAFRPLTSFTPILAYALAEQTALIVRSDAPWKNFREFIEYAKSNPGKVKYSVSGVGSAMHVAMEVIARKEGIKWVMVPFKGAAPATTALLGGHVHASAAGLEWQAYGKSGTVRALAGHGKKRNPDFPEVPTLLELGYDFSNDTIHGLVGPAGLPPAVRKMLEEAFRKGMETPEFKTTQQNLNLTPLYLNGEAYGKHLRERWTNLGKTMKESGIIKEAATNPE